MRSSLLRAAFQSVLYTVLLSVSMTVWGQRADEPQQKNDRTGRFMTRHESHLERAQSGPVGLLFLGDSITERWERHQELWNASFGAYEPANFGIGGDRTEHVLWRVTNGALEGIAPRAVVILIGTNNTATHSSAEIASGVGRIVETVRLKLPEAQIVLMGVFPRGPRTSRSGRVDDVPARMAAIREINERQAAMADGERVRFLDIGSRFMTPDGAIPDTLMPDQLHLSAEGYQVWADGLKPVLAEIFGDVRVP